MSAALRTGQYPFAPLVRVQLPDYTLCHLVGSAEVPFNGERFVGEDSRFGILVAASNLKDGVADEAPDWSLTFVPPTEVAASELAAATAQGGEVAGWLGLIDPSTGRLLPEPIQLFAGSSTFRACASARARARWSGAAPPRSSRSMTRRRARACRTAGTGWCGRTKPAWRT